MKKNSFTRRHLLEIGTGITFAAAGGFIWRANERGVFAGPEGEPYRPWEVWNAPEHRGTPLALIAAGVLASNPHNTQPWIFRVTENRIGLFADTRRHLGSFDPYLREMHIGLGCAVENMVLAAAPNGYAVTVVPEAGPLPGIGEAEAPVLAATLHLAPGGASADPLYSAIPKRHTNRYAYSRDAGLPEGITGDFVEAASADPLVRLVLLRDGAVRDALGGAIVAATEDIVADKTMIEDSHRWFRDGPAEMERERSGLELDTAGLSPALLKVAKFLPALPAEQSHGTWLNQTRETHVPSAALLGLIAVRDRHDRPQALAAGRLWQRLHLMASAAGVAMHPLNQPVEMIDRERQLEREPRWHKRMAEFAGETGWEPTFCFRAGMPTHAAPASARRSVETVTEMA